LSSWIKVLVSSWIKGVLTPGIAGSVTETGIEKVFPPKAALIGKKKRTQHPKPTRNIFFIAHLGF
jgi:hypothetical protein